MQIYVSKLLQHINGAWSLDGKLCVSVAQLFDVAVVGGGIFTHPVDVLFASSGINHQKKIVISEPVHDNVIHERARRVKHGRILRLADSQLCSIIHGDVLHSGQGTAVSPRGGNANVAHMANVKNSNAGANGFMLGDQPTGGGILNRHITTAEMHHFCAQTAVHSIQRRFTKLGCGGRIDGRLHKIQRKLILACTFRWVKKHSESLEVRLRVPCRAVSPQVEFFRRVPCLHRSSVSSVIKRKSIARAKNTAPFAKVRLACDSAWMGCTTARIAGKPVTYL